MSILLPLKIKVRAWLDKFNFWLKLKSDKVFYLSLGENCLTEHLLKRHGLNSFSTVFSNGRSNIDYALFLERTNYKNFLEFNNLKHDYLNETKVVRSTLVNQCDNIYKDLHMNGFELTHHDVLSDPSHKESVQRKINRILKWRKKKNVVFFYHHRATNSSDFEKLFNKCDEYCNYYTTNKFKSMIIVFSQNLVEDENKRKITYKEINNRTHFFEFHTTQYWEGDNNDILWAKNDFDLTEKMINSSKDLIDKFLK